MDTNSKMSQENIGENEVERREINKPGVVYTVLYVILMLVAALSVTPLVNCLGKIGYVVWGVLEVALVFVVIKLSQMGKKKEAHERLLSVVWIGILVTALVAALINKLG